MGDPIDCISCDGKVPEAEPNEVYIEYDIFCDSEKGEATIMVCDHCAKEDNDPTKHLVIELISVAKIFRIKNPDAVLTPTKKKKKPEEHEGGQNP